MSRVVLTEILNIWVFRLYCIYLTQIHLGVSMKNINETDNEVLRTRLPVLFFASIAKNLSKLDDVILRLVSYDTAYSKLDVIIRLVS